MKIIVSECAVLRLKAIYEYYKKEASVKVATGIKDKIITRIKELRQHPGLGQKEESLAFLGKGHRRLTTGNYKIIYYTEGKTLYITDIFDARQHPEKAAG